VTGWALESGGVAVVVTTTAEGEPRETHVWFAERDGALWIEAGAPGNGGYVDATKSTPVRFERLTR
jgi:hypothetical protein